MVDMLPFNNEKPVPRGVAKEPTPGIDNGHEIPPEMDIFYRTIETFLPEGKTFNDLTPEEEKRLRNQYRFSPYRPGIYQAITGLGKMIN